MKARTLSAIFMAVLLIFAAGCAGGKSTTSSNDQAQAPKQDDKKTYKIGITQIVEHPSLDLTREGFIAALQDNGITENDNLELDVQIAQGDPSNNVSIAQKFAADKKDLVLAISTPSAQSAAQVMKDTPILFGAVTDPLGAKLVQSLDKPGGNVTGISDTHPKAISNLMEFIAKEFPKTKTVGIVANDGEQNSVVNVNKAEEALSKLGIKVVKASVTNSSEVKQGAESLVGRVDAIYIPKDNTVIAALESIIQVAKQNQIPLFVGDKDSVKRGGFASYGIDYFDHGYAIGQLAVDILKNGKKPADIPVSFPGDESLNLAINMKAAREEGIEVTQSMKDKVKDKKNIIE